MKQHHSLDYVEFSTTDLSKTKAFFSHVFGWSFTDFGDQYSAFDANGRDGGFYQSDKIHRASDTGLLIVLFSNDLEQTLTSVEQHGGEISHPIFSFPGGRRFHFIEPGGNELAVWALEEVA